MSVQKYIIGARQGGYTAVPNNVIQNIHDYEALGLYIYLASLPTGWEFHKNQLRQHGNIGVNKIDNLIKKLCAYQLVEIAHLRNPDGTFAHFTMTVLDGSSFKNIDLDKSAQPFNEKPLTVNHSMVNSSYKDNKDKNNTKDKDNISCASVKKRPDARECENDGFEDFWKIYPNKKDKARARKRWEKLKQQDRVLILAKLREQVARDTQFQGDPQYIPLPSTYLHGRRWEDEIRVAMVDGRIHPKFPNGLSNNSRPEVKSTVGWYGGVDPARV